MNPSASFMTAIAVSRDGRSVAFVRGAGAIIEGKKLEAETELELVLVDAKGRESKVTDIRWIPNRYAKRPPSVMFSPDAKLIYFTEDVIHERRIGECSLMSR